MGEYSESGGEKSLIWHLGTSINCGGGRADHHHPDNYVGIVGKKRIFRGAQVVFMIMVAGARLPQVMGMGNMGRCDGNGQ